MHLDVPKAGCVGDTVKVDIDQHHILHPGEVSMLAEAGRGNNHQQGGRSRVWVQLWSNGLGLGLDHLQWHLPGVHWTLVTNHNIELWFTLFHLGYPLRLQLIKSILEMSCFSKSSEKNRSKLNNPAWFQPPERCPPLAGTMFAGEKERKFTKDFVKSDFLKYQNLSIF